MERKEQMYEGKAKKVYATDDENYCIISYKDDATAFNGVKKGTILGKGVVNNKMSNYIMSLMEKEGIPTHFVKELNDRDAVVKRVTIVPLEVIVRNIAAGSFSNRFGVAEGTKLLCPTLEYCYKDDALGDPMVNDYHILACGWATREDLDTISAYAFKINDFLIDFFKKINVDLVDFKIEFGKTPDGTIILADEISPDTCRLWDADTHEKLDKDRFRRDLGNVEGAYQEMMHRIFGDRN
jgi:phosphoribosylaminoimidazole-succinocarboxamide synthase